MAQPKIPPWCLRYLEPHVSVLVPLLQNPTYATASVNTLGGEAMGLQRGCGHQKNPVGHMFNPLPCLPCRTAPEDSV